jgi:SPOR domain
MLGQLHSTIARASVFAAVIAYCALAGCSSSNPDATGDQKQSPESQKEMKKPLSYYEATLDPSKYEDDVEVVEQKKSEDRDTTELRIPKDSTVVQETSQLGFRIQIYSTSSIDEAMNTRTNVLTKLPRDSVYIVYDPPIYKIRLGDFQTRYDASIELPTIVNLGYADAWIVPDNIVRRKIIQVPRQAGQQ